MGYDNRFTGAITITPPLTWAEIRDGVGVSDVKVRLVEEVVDTETGQNKVLTGDAIIPLGMTYTGISVAEDIQAIVDWYGPRRHSFAGYIQVQWDPGFEDPIPQRYVVVDGRVETVTPRLVWPGEEQRTIPAHMNAADLAAVLADMAGHVEDHDSFDGTITYEISDRKTDEYDVTAFYRVGNSMGQGGSRIIQGKDDDR